MFSFGGEPHRAEGLQDVELAEVPFVKAEDASGGTRSECPAVVPASAISSAWEHGGPPGHHPGGRGSASVEQCQRPDGTVLEGMLHTEGMGPVDVKLTADFLSWHRHLGAHDAVVQDAMPICCWPSRRPQYEASIPVSEIYAVEFCEVGEVVPRQKPTPIGRYGRRPVPAPKMYRFVVHTFDRCGHGSGRWIPREIVFGHGSFPQCTAWVDAIQQRIHTYEDRPRRLLVIVNPYGGKKMALQTWESVRPIFEKAGVSSKVVKTEYFRHAFHMMEQAPDSELVGVDGVVIVGGDGLFNEVLNGLLKTRHMAPVPQQPKPPSAPPANPHPVSFPLLPLKPTAPPSYTSPPPNNTSLKQSPSSTLTSTKPRAPPSRSINSPLKETTPFSAPSFPPTQPVSDSNSGYAVFHDSSIRHPLDNNPLLDPKTATPSSPSLRNSTDGAANDAAPFSFTSLFASPFSYTPVTSEHGRLPTEPDAPTDADNRFPDSEEISLGSAGKHSVSPSPPRPGSSLPSPSPPPPPWPRLDGELLREGVGVGERSERGLSLCLAVEHTNTSLEEELVAGSEHIQPSSSGRHRETVPFSVFVADNPGTGSAVYEETPPGVSAAGPAVIDGVRWPSARKKLRIGLIPAGSTDAVVVSTTGARDAMTSALHIVLGDRIPLDIVRLTTWTSPSNAPTSRPSRATRRTSPGGTQPETPTTSAHTLGDGEAVRDGDGKRVGGVECERDVRYAASFAGYGFYGDVMQDSEMFRWMGPMRYDWSGFWTFLKHESYEAEVIYLEVPEGGGNTGLEIRDAAGSCSRPPSPASIRALDESRDIRQRVAARSPGATPSPRLVSSSHCGTFTKHGGGASGQSSEGLSLGTGLIRRHSVSPARTDISPGMICRASCHVCKSAGDLLHLADEAEALELSKRFGEGVIVPEKCRRELSASAENLRRMATSMEGTGELTGQQRRTARWRKVRGKFHSVAAAVMSCRQGKAPGGVSAHAHLADGNLDLILIRECSHFNYLRQLISLTQKGMDPFDFDFLEHHKTPMFSFSAVGKRSTWNVDGELVVADQLVAQVFRGLIDIFARGPEN